MPSAHYVNFAVRANKTVERKLVFKVLTVLSPVLQLSGYRYVGLGAPWFVDFVMAHKDLSITDMISIERDEILASRAAFNRPYSCVKVIHGDSQIVLPDLGVEDRPLVAWLDYDTGLDGPVLEDLSTLCGGAPSGSIIVVTLNAHRGQLPTCDDGGNRIERFADRVRALAGDLIPSDIPRAATQSSGYPPFLASIIFDHMRRQVRTAGRANDTLLPLFNIGYKDGAPMITVGGIVANSDQAQCIVTVLGENDMSEFLNERRHLHIGVPPLTIKEKTGLDQLMPRDDPPSVKEVEDIGFKLKPAQIEAYHRYYLYYPIFGEVSV